MVIICWKKHNYCQNYEESMKKTWRKYEVSPSFYEETMKLNLAQLTNNLQVEPKNMKFLAKKFFSEAIQEF